jgi:hypothetical protein
VLAVGWPLTTLALDDGFVIVQMVVCKDILHNVWSRFVLLMLICILACNTGQTACCVKAFR